MIKTEQYCWRLMALDNKWEPILGEENSVIGMQHAHHPVSFYFDDRPSECWAFIGPLVEESGITLLACEGNETILEAAFRTVCERLEFSQQIAGE